MVKVEITEKRLVARAYDWERSCQQTPEREIDASCSFGLDSAAEEAEIHFANGKLSVLSTRRETFEFGHMNDLRDAIRQMCSLFNPFTVEYTVKLTRKPQ